MKILSTILLSIGFLLFMEGIVSACQCIEPVNPTPEQLKKKHTEEPDWANVIFLGEVLSVDTFKVKFKVDRVWKGKHQSQITMATGSRKTKEGFISKEGCEFEFRIGEKYVVYAKTIEIDLQTYQCTGTSPHKNAEVRIKFLNELQQKKN